MLLAGSRKAFNIIQGTSLSITRSFQDDKETGDGLKLCCPYLHPFTYNQVKSKPLEMNWQEFIIEDEDILAGKPTIKGTRLSVEFLVGLLAQGWTEEQILENYPRLKREHLKAIFYFIQECFRDGLMYKRTST
jgi:uncharacterized protein (DUF433 family)